MSIKDNLLFLGQPKDGKEKQTVFGKLAEIVGLMGKSNDDTALTITEKLDAIYNVVNGGMKEFSSQGTYEFIVPVGITRLKITAIGGGGGAGATVHEQWGGKYYNYYVGAGGSSGACINSIEYAVIPKTKLIVTVGKGGKSTQTHELYSENGIESAHLSLPKGENGTPTIIGNLVTLPGGFGGQSRNTKNKAFGGTSSGVGSIKGSDGLARHFNTSSGGGSRDNDSPNIGTGGITTLGKEFGAGGSPEYHGEYSGSHIENGKDGYVKIEWGLRNV